MNTTFRTPLPKTCIWILGGDEITGGGLPQGRPTLVCGGAGCGKTPMGMEFLVHAALDFDEPGVFVSFEETSDELTQNMTLLGFNLPDFRLRNKLLVDCVYIERSESETSGEYNLDGLFIRREHAIHSVGAQRVVLVSGMAGSGLTGVAAHFVDATCQRGEWALYISFEESQVQVIRNTRSFELMKSRRVDQEPGN